MFSFLISLLLAGARSEAAIRGEGGGPTCPLCSIIGVDIVECMTCLRLIRQTIFAIVTPIALAEISARRWKFSYRESLRDLVTIRFWYGTTVLRVLPRFLSEMEEDILSMRSPVFSHSHTIASDPCISICVSPRHCSPSTVFKVLFNKFLGLLLQYFSLEISEQIHWNTPFPRDGNNKKEWKLVSDLKSHSFEDQSIVRLS